MPQTPWPALVPAADLAGRPPLPLARPITLVGSRHTANIRISSSTISKAHALILNSEGSLYIRDLASRTGVIVNGTPVRECALRDGDEIRLGRFTFRYSAGPASHLSRRRRTPVAAILELEDGAQLSLAQRVVLIGQRDSSDLVIPDEKVSTAHAVLFDLNGRRYICDLGSRTGTFVNNHQITQSELKPGDQLRIGGSVMRYRAAAAAPAEAEAPAKPRAPRVVEEARPAVRSRPQAEAILPPADAELEKLFAEMAAVAPAAKAEEPEPLALEEPAQPPPLPLEEPPVLQLSDAHALQPAAEEPAPLELEELAAPPPLPSQVATASAIEPVVEAELTVTPASDRLQLATPSPLPEMAAPVEARHEPAPEPPPEVEPEPITIIPPTEPGPAPVAAVVPLAIPEPVAEVVPEAPEPVELPEPVAEPVAEVAAVPEALPELEPLPEPVAESLPAPEPLAVPVVEGEPATLTEPPAEVALEAPEPVELSEPLAEAPGGGEPVTAIEPETVAEISPERVPEPDYLPEPVPEAEPEPVAEVAPDPETLAELEYPQEAVAEAMPEVEPEPVAEPVAEVEAEPLAELETAPEALPELEPLPEPVAESLPAPEPLADAITEVEALPEPQPVAEVEPELLPETAAETALEQELLAESVAEVAPELETLSDLEPLPEPVAESLPAPEPLDEVAAEPEYLPEPVAEATPEPEPVAEAEPELMPETAAAEIATEQEPLEEPIAEAAPEASPDLEPIPEPVAEIAPEPEVLPEVEPVTDLAPEPLPEYVAEPVGESAPETEPLPAPVAEVTPEPEPLAEPVAEVVSELEPVAEVPPEPEALAELEPLPEPVAESLPAPEPLAEAPGRGEAYFALDDSPPPILDTDQQGIEDGPAPADEPVAELEPAEIAKAPADAEQPACDAVLAPPTEPVAVDSTPLELPTEQLAQFDDIADDSPVALNPNDSLSGVEVMPQDQPPMLEEVAEEPAPAALGDDAVLALFDDEEAPAPVDDPNNASYAGEYIPGVSPEPALDAAAQPEPEAQEPVPELVLEEPPAVEIPPEPAVATASEDILGEAAQEPQPEAPAPEPELILEEPTAAEVPAMAPPPLPAPVMLSSDAQGVEAQPIAAAAPVLAQDSAMPVQERVIEPSETPALTAPASASMPAPQRPAGPLNVRFFSASDTQDDTPDLVPLTLSNYSSAAASAPPPPPPPPPMPTPAAPRRPSVQFISSTGSRPVALSLPVSVPATPPPPPIAVQPVAPLPVLPVQPPPPPPASQSQPWNTGGIRPPGTGPLRSSHRRSTILADDVVTGTASGTSDDLHLSATGGSEPGLGQATASEGLADTDIFALNAPAAFDEIASEPDAPQLSVEPVKEFAPHRTARANRGPIVPPKVGAWSGQAESAPVAASPRVELDLDQVLGTLPETETASNVMEPVEVIGKPAAPRRAFAPRRRHRGALILLIVVLLATVLAAGLLWFLKLQHTWSLGSIVYDTLETLDPAQRGAFEQQQLSLLNDAALRQQADRAAPLQAAVAHVPLLPTPKRERHLKHEFATDGKARVLKVTLEGNDSDSDGPWLNALLIGLYEHPTNRALRDKAAGHASARAELRGQLASRKRELVEENRRRDALQADLKNRPTEAERKTARSEYEARTAAVTEIARQLLSLEDQARKLTSAADSSNPPPAPRDDPKLKEMTEQVASLQAAMTRTREEAARKSEQARKAMDQAIDRLQSTIGNTQAVIKDNPALAEYIAGANSLFNAAQQSQRDLIAVQERQQQQLQSIGKLLREQAEKRRKEMVDSDADLRGLQAVLDQRLKELANAQQGRLTQEIARLEREIDQVNANINARKQELASDPFDQAGLQAVQEIIDANNKQMESDRARSEQILKERKLAFDKTAPKVDGLPKAQQAFAAQLKEQVNSMEAARKSYNEVIAAEEEAAQALLKKQQTELDALQAEIVSRKEKLAAEQQKSLTQAQAEQLAAIQKQIKDQRTSEVAAKAAESQALGKFQDAEWRSIRAEQADKQSQMIAGTIKALQQEIASLSAAESKTEVMVVPRPPTLAWVRSSDPRPLYISATLLVGFVLSAAIFLLSAPRKSDTLAEQDSVNPEVELAESRESVLSQN